VQPRLTEDRRVIVANYLATNRKPKSVANLSDPFLALWCKNDRTIFPHVSKTIAPRRFLANNAEELVWKQSGKPLTKRELAGFLA
jgi:hypothetical protein